MLLHNRALCVCHVVAWGTHSGHSAAWTTVIQHSRSLLNGQCASCIQIIMIISRSLPQENLSEPLTLQWCKKMFLNRGAIKYTAHKARENFLDHTSMLSNHAHFCATLAVKRMLIYKIS